MSKAARRTITLLIALGLAVSVAGWVAAQQPAAPAPQPGASASQAADQDEDLTSDLALTRASIQLRRQAIVTSVMDLTPKEAEAFWPLYREYRMEMAKVGDRVSKLLVDYTGQYDTLTDEQAKKIMNEWLSIEKAKMNVKGKYVSKFQKILPARKTMRFFQADNKLDAVINAQLASIVPLAR
jgi:DNA-directed RNA polymerase subunit F